MKASEKPLWRKSLLHRLSLYSIRSDLQEIADNGDYYGYETKEDEYGYYDDYRPLFDELAFGAGDLEVAICDHYDIAEYWDDMTVALLGDTRQVLGYDWQEDYCAILDHEQMWAQEECVKRLRRWTKDELIARFRTVMGTLMAYTDIKGSYDILSATVAELEEKAAIMKKRTEAIDRLYADFIGENISDKTDHEFERLVAALPQRSWLE